MLSNRVVCSLREANLYDKERLRYIEDWELTCLPGIGPATVKKIRSEFGKSVYSMSSKEQAKYFGIPYEEIEAYKSKNGWSIDSVNWNKNPEPIAAEYYRKLGYECEYGENYTFDVLMQALLYPLLKSKGVPLFFNRDSITVESRDGMTFTEPTLSIYHSKLYEIIKKCPDKVVHCISTSILPELKTGLKATRHGITNEIDDQHFIEAWKVLGKDKIKQLGRCYVSNTAYVGWPDLSLFRENKLVFVEIKANDNLTRNQIDWWINVGKPIGLNVQITKINSNKQ